MRYHYICCPNYSVATKKRHTSKPMPFYFFNVLQERFICKARAVLVIPQNNIGTAVPLAAAKLLAQHDPRVVQAFCFLSEKDEDDFIAEIESQYRERERQQWFAPAGTDRGRLNLRSDLKILD